MVENHYAYAVARIRVKECGLLTQNDWMQLIGASSSKECLSILKDRGWDIDEGDMSSFLKNEIEKNEALLEELIKEKEVVDILHYLKVFDTLKNAIKKIGKDEMTQNKIEEAVNQGNFDQLPAFMQTCAREAYNIQLHSGESWRSDTLIDWWALYTLYEKSRVSKELIIRKYGEAKVGLANIEIALRSAKRWNQEDYLLHACVNCQSVDKEKLIEATCDSKEKLYAYLQTTCYKECVAAAVKGTWAFEKWADEWMISQLYNEKNNPFTLAAPISYYLVKENEIKNVSLLITAKQKGIHESSLMERLRKTYV